MAGAPKGNKNAAKKRLPWQGALKRSLTRLADKEGEESPNYRKGLDKIADEVVAQALNGHKDAWMEIGNRLEGKPGQSMELSGPDRGPIPVLAYEFVDVEDKEEE